MGSTREKGKISRNEWPAIIARYSGGETIASIGRAYGCTAPAIRYIVKRSGLLKSDAGDRPAAGGSRPAARQRIRQSDAGYVAGEGGTAVARAGGAMRGRVLEPELRKRVSGDVASFLVALDQLVLDGSRQSIGNLQEATDRLMRSIARTRLELEKMLGKYEGTEMLEDSEQKVVTARQRGA